jgi:hypothetical protein
LSSVTDPAPNLLDLAARGRLRQSCSARDGAAVDFMVNVVADALALTKPERAGEDK